MIHRLALLIGGLAAAVVLAYSLARGDRAALDAPVDEASMAATAVDTTTPRQVVDTVYIAAPRRPKVVHVTRRAKATPRPDARSARQHGTGSASEEGREHEDGEHERREHEDDD